MLIDFKILEEKYGIKTHGVMHVGMHKAEEYPKYKECGVETVIFIEANKNLAHACTIEDENCYIVHAAVSDKVEEIEFNIMNNGESSSILALKDHAYIYPHIYKVDSVKMKTTTIDSINRKLGLNEQAWNFLNLDIQGAELKALKGIGDWRFIDAIYTEVNYREMYEGCPLVDEIDAFLDEKGFKKVEEVDTGAGWGDALYIRK